MKKGYNEMSLSKTFGHLWLRQKIQMPIQLKDILNSPEHNILFHQSVKYEGLKYNISYELLRGSFPDAPKKEIQVAIHLLDAHRYLLGVYYYFPQEYTNEIQEFLESKGFILDCKIMGDAYLTINLVVNPYRQGLNLIT